MPHTPRRATEAQYLTRWQGWSAPHDMRFTGSQCRARLPASSTAVWPAYEAFTPTLRKKETDV
jgi:hypothetical protein